MIIISGLGNPGKEYKGSRHNLGFEIIDKLQEELGFPEFKKKFDGLYSKGYIFDEEIVFFKPQIYMNLSGSPIKKILGFFKVNPKKNLFVVHDDLDLTFPKFRVKTNGGHGGHNGIRDIIKHIGNDFYRLKFGIKNKLLVEKRVLPNNFVLNKFSKKETEVIIKLKKRISTNFTLLVNRNFSMFANSLDI